MQAEAGVGVAAEVQGEEPKAAVTRSKRKLKATAAKPKVYHSWRLAGGGGGGGYQY
jgi:hypothetical protein